MNTYSAAAGAPRTGKPKSRVPGHQSFREKLMKITLRKNRKKRTVTISFRATGDQEGHDLKDIVMSAATNGLCLDAVGKALAQKGYRIEHEQPGALEIKRQDSADTAKAGESRRQKGGA